MPAGMTSRLLTSRSARILDGEPPTSVTSSHVQPDEIKQAVAEVPCARTCSPKNYADVSITTSAGAARHLPSMATRGPTPHTQQAVVLRVPEPEFRGGRELISERGVCQQYYLLGQHWFDPVPAGVIKKKSPAWHSRTRTVRPEPAGLQLGDGSCRGNHEVMIRATFATPSARNKLVEPSGGFTLTFPDGEETTIYQAAIGLRRGGSCRPSCWPATARVRLVTIEAAKGTASASPAVLVSEPIDPLLEPDQPHPV